jgi:hypothetical protein
MKAEVEIVSNYRFQIEVPDDFCDRARAQQQKYGDISIYTDKEYMEHIAIIRGIRGIDWLELFGEEMSNEIVCYEIDGDEEVTSVTFI